MPWPSRWPRSWTTPQTDEVNPAAIEVARGQIRGFNQGIDLAIDEYLARFDEGR